MSNEVKRPGYWKSLGELANNEAYKEFQSKEFQDGADELKDGVSRRTFLRVMGASVALAGFAACRRPVQKILPYTYQPEDRVAGIPLEYATAMPFQDVLTGLLVENYEGRPTRVNGNPDHPNSKGGSGLFHQASILGMYDPDRSHNPIYNGEKRRLKDFVTFAEKHFEDTSKSILFISEANSSATYTSLKKEALKKFDNASWVTYEAFGEENVLEGTKIAFGQRLRPIKNYGADVVVSFDDDFLCASANKNSVIDSRNFSQARKMETSDATMNRLYVLENSFTNTGSAADNRLRIKYSEIPLFVVALAAELGLSGFGSLNNAYSSHPWVKAVAKDLKANQGSSLVTAGYSQSKEVHAVVAAINDFLGNTGETVSYKSFEHFGDYDNTLAFTQAVKDMAAGKYDTVIMIGTNPVLTAPKTLDFENALAQVKTSIHFSDYLDETSKVVNWHVNRAHYLEAWGDGYSYSGVASFIQPMIQPLFDGVSDIEFLNIVATSKKKEGYDLVRAEWGSKLDGNFEEQWRKALHDGFISDHAVSSVSVRLNASAVSTAASSLKALSKGIELVLKADSKIFDGRYANNGWLQELPHGMTKIAWDNVALMSPATAKKLGVEGSYNYEEIEGLGQNETELVELTVNGKSLKVPAWILPGHAEDSITLTVGYGREGLGSVANMIPEDGDAVGVDTYVLTSDVTAGYLGDVDVKATGESYPIACTQDHASMHGRELVREATVAEYKANPSFASYKDTFGFAVPGMEEAEAQGEHQPISLFNEQEGPDYEPQWGMSIDLNACFGCGVCVIACQSENNIPVIGKREVRRGREISWLRIDRYFKGDADNPEAKHLPVACQHCEMAPCEQVCPVAATTHSDDGLNQMTYNRCIGTRYCANNCPYKVRRFNFFNYTKEYLTKGNEPEVIQMAMNPDVTVRFRGVMEKCTYCVQRINRAKIETKNKTGHSVKPADGMVKTACQSACPADAISFGDISDKNSTVRKVKEHERSYALLEELNVRPRTSYVAKVKNPNPELV